MGHDPLEVYDMFFTTPLLGIEFFYVCVNTSF